MSPRRTDENVFGRQLLLPCKVLMHRQSCEHQTATAQGCLVRLDEK